MWKLSILDTVISHFTEKNRVTVTKTRKHLLHRHVNLLVLEKLLRDVVQGVALELVFTLDVLEHIKHVTSEHRNHLQIVRPERVGRQVFHNQFVRDASQTTPHVCIRTCTRDDRACIQVLQIEPEDVPASHNVWVKFTEVSTQTLEHLTLRIKRFTLRSARLLDTKALPVKVFLVSKRLCGHSHLKTRVIRLERIRERPRL